MPWEQGSNPNRESAVSDARLGRVSLSSLQPDDEHYVRFFAGWVLADIHASGHRRCRLSSRQLRPCPSPGHLGDYRPEAVCPGFRRGARWRATFSVPALSGRSPSLRAAVVMSSARITRIEALNPGFNYAPARGLGRDRPTDDPLRSRRGGSFRALSLRRFSHATAETERL